MVEWPLRQRKWKTRVGIWLNFIVFTHRTITVETYSSWKLFHWDLGITESCPLLFHPKWQTPKPWGYSRDSFQNCQINSEFWLLTANINMDDWGIFKFCFTILTYTRIKRASANISCWCFGQQTKKKKKSVMKLFCSCASNFVFRDSILSFWVFLGPNMQHTPPIAVFY